MCSEKYIVVNALAFITLPCSFYVKSYPFVSCFNITSQYLLICLKLPAGWHTGIFYMVCDRIFCFPLYFLHLVIIQKTDRIFVRTSLQPLIIVRASDKLPVVLIWTFILFYYFTTNTLL